MSKLALLLTLLSSPLAHSLQEAPYSGPSKPADGGASYLGPGSFCGIEETSFSDPDWIMMTSDRIVRSSDCVAECEACPECWYDLAPGAPCYSENRYWKFAEGVDYASAFPMGALGIGTFDGMYVKPGIEVQFYQGSDTETPFGPMLTSPVYASIDYWSIACEGFEPGTFLVSGGPGALGDYSLTLNGGCKGRVLWEDGKPIEGASVVAYALQFSGSEIVAVPVGTPEITDSEGKFAVPDGMSLNDFPALPGELGVTRAVRATITYTEDSGVQNARSITNYPRWDPLLPMTRQQTGTEEIYVPFPVIFQPGVSGTYNSGSADALRGFMTADPGVPSGLSSQLYRIKQGRGYDHPIPAFPFFGMPSRDVFGPYPNDGISWGYDNSAIQTAGSVADSAVRLELHLLTRVIPELQQFTPEIVPINMTGHSLGGIISRRWVNRGYAVPRLNKYVTFDAVHGGTALIANNFIPNLLNEILMNGLIPLFGSYLRGWNSFNSIPTRGNTLLFASVDEHIVIDPSVSAFGIGRIFEQGLLWNSHSGTCLRSVGGWELAVPNRGHSIQNEPEVMVSAARFLAGYPPALGTQTSPGSPSTAAGFSGPPAVLCPAPLGPGGSAATEFFELGALAGNTTVAVLTPGDAASVSVQATLVGPASLSVHDDLGTELTQTNLVSTELGPETVSLSFQVALPAGLSELRLSAGASEVLGYIGVGYPNGVAATVETDSRTYAQSASVQISASLADPGGLVLVGTNASASVDVGFPDGTTQALTLLDDGAHGDGAANDGVFGNSFTDTLLGGTYSLSAALSADLGGTSYRRMSSSAFGVTPSGATFLGAVNESLVDDDTNGLAEAIRFEFGIDATANGEYSVQADLVDDSATVVGTLSGTVEITAAPATALVAIDLDALTLRRLGSAGAFTLESILLVDVEDSLPADVRPDHLTGIYALSQFEPAPAPLLSRCFPSDDSVSGGAQILLFGQNLQDATGVFVAGGAAPDFTVVTDTSVLFTAPPGPLGPTTVRVTTPWNQTIQQGIFRYVENGAPVVVDPPSLAPDCQAGTIDFTVVASGTAPLAYQWRKDDLDIPGATDALLTIVGFGASDFGSYDVVVSNALGMTTSPDLTLVDCNGSGVLDLCDVELGTSLDCNGNLEPDECEVGAVDCNANGVIDSCDIAAGTSADCNANGLPDECDVAALDCNANGTPDDCELDCNANGVPDDCDIAAGESLDCNANAVPDDCDIASGTSLDCDANGVPDECDPDCNANGLPDDCDIAGGTSPDCNANGTPDECDLAAGTSLDCNANGVPDECDIASGTSLDCNANGVPDECDLASGASSDCDGNGIPDECDIAAGTLPDCNGNGIPECPTPGPCPCEFADCNANCVPDGLDISSGTSEDCNGNGIPDECDISFGTSFDCNGDGVPDECQPLITIFVDDSAGGANNGTSWADAYTELESALSTAELCDAGNEREIWVASGTYSPTRESDEGVLRSATFSLLADTRLYGGFAGTETLLGQRDVQANPTILSGALQGGATDAFHVVTAIGVDATARLDGFTIRGGNANGAAAPHDVGGGMRIEAASPLLSQCTFDDNRADRGGALYVSLSSILDWQDCDFVGVPSVSGNLATEAGGAIYLADTSQLSLAGATFSGARSNGGEGGAIYCAAGSVLTLVDAAFVDNIAARGGAILCDGATLSLSSCRFEVNRSAGAGANESLGGALFGRGAGTLDLRACQFIDNRATNGGGALYVIDSTDLSVRASRFDTNSALSSVGGAAYLGGSATNLFRGSYFDDNAADAGGAIYAELGASTSLLTCSLVANVAQSGLGGGLSSEGPNLSLNSCLLWDNLGSGSVEADQLSVGSGSPSVNYCAVEEWSGTIDATGIGNLGGAPLDPLFVDATGNDYHLLGDSPLRDAGDPAFAPELGELDHDGEPRVEGPGLDIGCDEVTDCNLNLVPDYLDITNGTSLDGDLDGIPDECNGDCNGNGIPDVDDLSGGTSQDCNANGIPDECDIASGASDDVNSNGVPDECDSGIVFYVNQAALGADDGTSWTDAYLDLQDALDAVQSTGAVAAQVWIASGTYVPSRETQAGVLRSASFSLTSETSLYGGFAGTETSLEERDIVANPTILTGDLGGTAAYHVVSAANIGAGVVLSGLTLTGGNANAASGPDQKGAGLTILDSSPTLRQCTFSANNASGGGAVWIGGSSAPLFVRCSFASNTASLAGAALQLADTSSATVRLSSFTNNSATGDEGGAIYCSPGTSFTARGSDWTSGRAGRGGALYLDGATLELFACTFFDNRVTGAASTSSLGGSIYSTGSSSTTLTRCTMRDGRAREGAGIYLIGDGQLRLDRSELRSQVASTGLGAGIFAGGSSTVTLLSSYLVDNRATGTGPPWGNGGALYLTGSAVADLTLSTLADNGATSGEGAGVYCSLGTSVSVDSCVFWDNRSQSNNLGETAQLYFEPGAGGGSSVDYSCVAGWTGGLPVAGGNNLGGTGFDPLFVAPASLDYHLRVNSPCVDRGDPGYAAAPGERDFDGEERVRGSRVDMGFDEAYPKTKDFSGAIDPPQIGG